MTQREPFTSLFTTKKSPKQPLNTQSNLALMTTTEKLDIATNSIHLAAMKTKSLHLTTHVFMMAV